MLTCLAASECDGAATLLQMPLGLRLKQRATGSAAAAQWQLATTARVAPATGDPAENSDVGIDQTLTQVPLDQRLPHKGRQKLSVHRAIQQPAAAADNISHPPQPRSPAAAPAGWPTASARNEPAACPPPQPMPLQQLQQMQPQPQQAAALQLGTDATRSAVPHPLLLQQQSASAGPAQRDGARTVSASGPPEDAEEALSFTERIRQRRQALAAAVSAPAAFAATGLPPGPAAAHKPEPERTMLPQWPVPQLDGGPAPGAWHWDGASGLTPISLPAAAIPAPIARAADPAQPAAGPLAACLLQKELPTLPHTAERAEAECSPQGDVPLTQVQHLLEC